MEDFVPFEIAKKLKEKGVSCKYPFAMYDEDGVFYPLFTSCDEDEDSKCIFGNRMYYDYDDFLKYKDAIIAPTISQVLKWLREEKKIHIEVFFGSCGFCWDLILNIKYVEGYNNSEWGVLDCEKYAEINNQENHSTYEQAALAGIEYVLDNLI